jgi:hypothetical protein
MSCSKLYSVLIIFISNRTSYSAIMDHLKLFLGSRQRIVAGVLLQQRPSKRMNLLSSTQEKVRQE